MQHLRLTLFHDTPNFTGHFPQYARRIDFSALRKFRKSGLDLPTHSLRLRYGIVGDGLCAKGLIRNSLRTRQRSVRLQLSGPRARLRHGQGW